MYNCRKQQLCEKTGNFLSLDLAKRVPPLVFLACHVLLSSSAASSREAPSPPSSLPGSPAHTGPTPLCLTASTQWLASYPAMMTWTSTRPSCSQDQVRFDEIHPQSIIKPSHSPSLIGRRRQRMDQQPCCLHCSCRPGQAVDQNHR